MDFKWIWNRSTLVASNLWWELKIAKIHISNHGEAMGQKVRQHVNKVFPRPFVLPAWRIPRASPWMRPSWWSGIEKTRAAPLLRFFLMIGKENYFLCDSKKPQQGPLKGPLTLCHGEMFIIRNSIVSMVFLNDFSMVCIWLVAMSFYESGVPVFVIAIFWW